MMPDRIPDNELPKHGNLIDAIKAGGVDARAIEDGDSGTWWTVNSGWLEYSGDNAIGHALIPLTSIACISKTNSGIEIDLRGSGPITMADRDDTTELYQAIKGNFGLSKEVARGEHHT